MLTLYGYWRSSATWRVRIALGLKAVPFEIVPVHLVRDGGEHKGAAHLARNPMAQVPVLQLDEGGVLLSQSLAIVHWLDARFPEPPLVPRDALAGARAWQLAEVVNAGIQPLQNLGIIRRLQALGVDADAWCREHIEHGLTALEAMVDGSDAAFMVGDRPTVADVCLVPQLYNGRRFGVDLTPFPTLLRVEAACEALPAFAAAHPDRQPDAVRS